MTGLPVRSGKYVSNKPTCKKNAELSFMIIYEYLKTGN